jgi:UDP-GlcNAc:undecaprenyl-phosphate GlcNAc-1-phosphate transferase
MAAMAELLSDALVAAAVAAVVTSLLVPPVIHLAVALRALDHPGNRKHHDRPIPRLGGVALAAGIGTALLFAMLILRSEGRLPISRNEILALGLGGAMVFVLGVVDDLFGVSVLNKFLIQLCAAFLLVRTGFAFDAISLPGGAPLELGFFGGAVSILWIVGVTNAINLIDGLDGLASGVVAITASSFLAYAVLQENALAAIAMAAVVGASVGFLRHNWSPARIYMGDSGSLTLGFLLAATSVHSTLKAPAAVAILVPLLALGVPVFDTLLVMVIRFLDEPRGPISARTLAMFRADRRHLHHLLLRLGRRREHVVLWIYGAVLVFCVLAVATAIAKSPTLGVGLLVTEGLAVLLLRLLGSRGGPGAIEPAAEPRPTAAARTGT